LYFTFVKTLRNDYFLHVVSERVLSYVGSLQNLSQVAEAGRPLTCDP
jgi:hypothetical protein